MGILRVEEVYFGVTDIPACVKFFNDFGLEEVRSDAGSATFRTPVGQLLHMLADTDPSLPPAVEDGPTIREIIWGVDSQETLDAFTADLTAEIGAKLDDEGVLHFTDNVGFGVGLRVARPEQVEATKREFNSPAAVDRWNQPQTNYFRARPVRVCHVALNIPKDGWEKSVAFYTDKLRFRVTDQPRDMGTFMQAENDDDQHTFLMAHRPDRASHNHLAYEVNNYDEVIEGGNYMVACGWKEARRLGRHVLGSNVFRFFQAPTGGRVEYAADMDRVDDSYGPNIYAEGERPPHHLWMLTSATDRDREKAQS